MINKETLDQFLETGKALRSQEEAVRQTRLAKTAEFLETTQESRLFAHGPDILEYAGKEQVDPIWLFSRLERAVMDSNLYQGPLRFPEDPNNPEEHYRHAMQCLEVEAYHNSIYEPAIASELRTAEQLSVEMEDPESPVRQSVAYRWMHENLGVLYEIHRREWWKNY